MDNSLLIVLLVLLVLGGGVGDILVGAGRARRERVKSFR